MTPDLRIPDELAAAMEANFNDIHTCEVWGWVEDHPEVAYLYGPPSEVAAFERLAEQAWLALPLGEDRHLTGDEPSDHWLRFVYTLLRQELPSYYDCNRVLRAVGVDGGRETIYTFNADQGAQAKEPVWEGRPRFRQTCLRVDPFSASVTALDAITSEQSVHAVLAGERHWVGALIAEGRRGRPPRSRHDEMRMKQIPRLLREAAGEYARSTGAVWLAAFPAEVLLGRCEVHDHNSGEVSGGQVALPWGCLKVLGTVNLGEGGACQLLSFSPFYRKRDEWERFNAFAAKAGAALVAVPPAWGKISRAGDPTTTWGGRPDVPVPGRGRIHHRTEGGLSPDNPTVGGIARGIAGLGLEGPSSASVRQPRTDSGDDRATEPERRRGRRSPSHDSIAS
jgi:hypothetical protein